MYIVFESIYCTINFDVYYESCNNDDKNRKRKTRITQYKDFTWFSSVPTSIRTTAQNFTIAEIVGVGIVRLTKS